MLAFCSLIFVHLACGNWSTDYEDEEEKVPPPKPSLYAYTVSISVIHLELVPMGVYVDGLKIERSKDDETNYTQIATIGDGYDYDDTGLKPGTTYYYRARGFNKAGDSPYSDSDYATTIYDGYGMCVQKTSWFDCPESRCGFSTHGSSYITTTGVEVLDCLNTTLIVPSTMTISFDYRARADTCYDEPVFEVMAGLQSKNFSFDCNSSSYGSISIHISDTLTIDDISFGLESGDWASWICIESITFTQ
ncbi:fibronectin type III domain-containing protein [Candidatus Falkowbacteria bacterium]|nr:fibronectin type III domain-containing protein [Candidatus Falkowbacteria bacterium]